VANVLHLHCCFASKKKKLTSYDAFENFESNYNHNLQEKLNFYYMDSYFCIDNVTPSTSLSQWREEPSFLFVLEYSSLFY
jgi:hypothetical protein